MFLPPRLARLKKAKQGAEAKGYVFLTNRDEIVAKAKKEGKLRILGRAGTAQHQSFDSGVHEEISLH
jgi:hypothetical protein